MSRLIRLMGDSRPLSSARDGVCGELLILCRKISNSPHTPASAPGRTDTDSLASTTIPKLALLTGASSSFQCLANRLFNSNLKSTWKGLSRCFRRDAHIRHC